MLPPERRITDIEPLTHPAIIQAVAEIEMLGEGNQTIQTIATRDFTAAVWTNTLAPNYVLNSCRYHLTGIPGFGNLSLIPSAAAPIIMEGLVKPQPHELNSFVQAFFSQDALIGQQMLFRINNRDMQQEMEASYQILKACAIYQARQTENQAGERISGMTSGQIAHEVRVRSDPLRIDLERRRRWRFPYYGSRLSTPVFINFLTDVVERNGGFDEAFLQEEVESRGVHSETIQGKVTMAESLFHALHCLELWLGAGNGLVFSFSANPDGTLNQSWTDSWNAKLDNHNKIITTGTYPLEIQVMVQEALQKGTRLLREITQTADSSSFFPSLSKKGANKIDLNAVAGRLEYMARQLSDRIVHDFTVDSSYGRTFTPYLYREDGILTQSNHRTSDIGWLLGTDFLRNHPEYADPIITELFDPEAGLIGRWGIRTFSANDAAYRSRSYHRGPYWPFLTNIFANGLWDMGHYGLAWQLYLRNILIQQASGISPEWIVGDDTPLPEINLCEVSCEMPNAKGPVKRVLIPVTQLYQFWTAAAFEQIWNMIYSLEAGNSIPLSAQNESLLPLETDIINRLKNHSLHISHKFWPEREFVFAD